MIDHLSALIGSPFVCGMIQWQLVRIMKKAGHIVAGQSASIGRPDPSMPWGAGGLKCPERNQTGPSRQH